MSFLDFSCLYFSKPVDFRKRKVCCSLSHLSHTHTLLAGSSISFLCYSLAHNFHKVIASNFRQRREKERKNILYAPLRTKQYILLDVHGAKRHIIIQYQIPSSVCASQKPIDFGVISMSLCVCYTVPLLRFGF